VAMNGGGAAGTTGRLVPGKAEPYRTATRQSRKTAEHIAHFTLRRPL
jgi:hypothetical protein